MPVSAFPSGLRRVLGLVVGLAVVVAAAGGCNAGRPPAAEVNGSEVSAEVLDDLLGALAGSIPEFKGEGADTFDADGDQLGAHASSIDRQIVADVARRRGVEISDADRTAGTTALLGALGQDEAAAQKVFDRLVLVHPGHAGRRRGGPDRVAGRPRAQRRRSRGPGP